MKILIAPSGYKESLDAEETAQAMKLGVMDAQPDATIRVLPLLDGGEGFAIGLTDAIGGIINWVDVTGPVGQQITAPIGMVMVDGIRTAVIDLASAAGLSLVPQDQRNPLRTTSYGFGQLIAAALDWSPDRILIGCGDSGINDGGAGMAVALGARLLDEDGAALGLGGAELVRLASIDLTNLDPRLETTPIVAALNPHNVLCGERGVARVFGPQKGATPAQVDTLAAAMDRYASVIDNAFGLEVGDYPGAGASGGVGAGLLAFCGAELWPRFDVVFTFLDIESALDDVDLVVTGEGRLDDQTPRGKIPAEVARRAEDRGIPTIAVAGAIGHGAESNSKACIDAWLSVVQGPNTLDHAIENAAELVRTGTAQAIRLVEVGRRVQETGPTRASADHENDLTQLSLTSHARSSWL